MKFCFLGLILLASATSLSQQSAVFVGPQKTKKDVSIAANRNAKLLPATPSQVSPKVKETAAKYRAILGRLKNASTLSDQQFAEIQTEIDDLPVGPSVNPDQPTARFMTCAQQCETEYTRCQRSCRPDDNFCGRHAG